MQSSRIFEERQCVLLKVFTPMLANSSSKTLLVDVKVVHNNLNHFGKKKPIDTFRFSPMHELRIASRKLHWFHKQLVRVLQHQKNLLPSLLQRKPENPVKDNITIISFFLPLLLGTRHVFGGARDTWWDEKKICIVLSPPLVQTLNQCWSYRKSTRSLFFQLESKHECKKCGVQEPHNLFFWIKTHVKTKRIGRWIYLLGCHTVR